MSRRTPASALLLAVALVAPLAVGLVAPAGGQAQPPEPVAPPDPVAAPLDAAQRETLDGLTALQAGALPDAVPVSTLFAVHLESLVEVEQRLAGLRAEVKARSEIPDPASETGRAIARARLDYLSALSQRLNELPEAARRVLPAIAEPRTALRERAAAGAALADALEALAGRVSELARRARAGMLVGFVSEARDLAAALEASQGALTARVAALRSVAAEQLALAEQLESEGRALRRQFFVGVLAPDRLERVDARFLGHVQEQRRLQRSVRLGATGVERRRFEELAAEAVALAPGPRRIGTVADAAAVVEPLGALMARTDETLDTGRGALDGWRLAFENEVVTLLSGQASEAARGEAYTLSRTLLRDVQAEAGLAWERSLASWQGLRAELGGPRGLTSSRALGWLARALGLVAVLGAWWLVRRFTGQIVEGGIRGLARAARGRFRLPLGAIVRWSGLLESALPALAIYPALRAAMALLGTDSLASSLLAALGLPLFAYTLGRRLLLGATRRISYGRPALIRVAPASLQLLQRTYARLGLFIAAAAALHGVALLAIGEGVIVRVVDGFALLWVGVWAAWEAVAWRPTLARAWRSLLGPDAAGPEARLATWMEGAGSGFALSPVALLRLALTHLGRGLVALSHRTDLAEFLAARRLRRAARNDDRPERSVELPAEYLREFPLHPALGRDDALLLPRDQIVTQVLEQIEQWKGTRSEGSLVILGEKGLGKTTLAALVARRVKDLVVVEHTLRGKPASGEELFRKLEPALPVHGVNDLGDWIDGLCAGPERVMLLDEAHNVFLRTVGGYRAYDALIELVNATSERVFWVLLFNSFTWRFLNESRSKLHYFRRLVQVPSWSSDELRELIRLRHERTGFDVEFDEMLLSGDRADMDRLELVEGADGFFRLLRETSGGNPRIATRLWLSSLRPVGEKKLRVSAFREAEVDVLDKLSDELLFALAAVTQHENLSTDELRRVLNVPEGLARFAVQYLLETGLVEPKDGRADRVTLAAASYRHTLRALRNRHLLFE